MTPHDQTQIREALRGALRQNVRAFRKIKTGAIQYTLGAQSESEWEEVMIIPNLPNQVIDVVLSAQAALEATVKESLTDQAPTERAPLVRLTDEELRRIWRGADSWIRFGRAVMDAMQERNK